MLFTIFFFVFIFHPYSTLSERRCRCLSNNPDCWPNATIWQKFNASINGGLIEAQPSAAVCNSNPPNVNACATAYTNWHNASWRDDQVGAMQNHNWENSSCSVYYNSTTCNQGSVPIYAVNATLPEHVQATVQFVSTYNLRLVMKTTGHDYLGRSTAFGSLLLWFHHMKTMTLVSNFSLCTGETVTDAIRLGPGVQWGDVYTWLAPYNLTAIGGASGTVGATGGFLQGGGHGPLTRWKGLAADQVLEFDVIMADGRRQTVNSCENSDLFWALRGGGAGTFAVVLSVVVRTYPSPSLIGCYQAVTVPDETRYANFIQHFTHFLPTLADDGWAGYFYFSMQSISFFFFLPNGDLHTAGETMNQLLENYTDFNFTLPGVFPLTSFYEMYAYVLARSNPTGDNVLLGSRLIPEQIIRHQADQVADVFFRAKGRNQSVLIGHLVAGGQVSNSTQNNSVNPVWRTTLLHMVYSRWWPDGTSIDDQTKIAKHVTEQVDILQTIAGGSQSGSYMNEANPNEPNWQQKYFGSMEYYNRLKSIKDTVDPNGLFVCKNCVGSDDWSDDLNCPKSSAAAEMIKSRHLFIIIMMFVLSEKVEWRYICF